MRRTILVLAVGAVCACGVGQAPVADPHVRAPGAGIPSGCFDALCAPGWSGGDPQGDGGTSAAPPSEPADAGAPRAPTDSGVAAADAGAPKPVVEACTASSLLDGGAYPSELLAQSRDRADALARPATDDAGVGCQVRGFAPDGRLVWLDGYDDAGRLLAHTAFLPDGSTSFVWHLFDDGGTEILRLEHEAGSPLTLHAWHYDGGELASETLQTGDDPPTQILWDRAPDGQPLRRTTQFGDGGTLVATWGYDGEGRVQRFQEGPNESDWEYDADGMVVRRDYADGGLVTREVELYDAAGHLVGRSRHVDEGPYTQWAEYWSYDDAGTLRHHESHDPWSLTDSDDYDERGRVIGTHREGTEFGETVRYDYDDAAASSSADWVIESTFYQSDGLAEWWFGVAPRVDLLAEHEHAHDWLKGFDGPRDSVTLRVTDAQGRLLLTEEDRDGDCQPDGRYEAIRDARGILREERFFGTRGEGLVTFTGRACPESPHGSAYGNPGYGFPVTWLDLTPRR